jgi:hypothetical protein
LEIQEYINSGIIDEYCLGLLSVLEQQEVEMQCSTYPELNKELLTAQALLFNYAAQFAQTPACGLEAQIWNTLENRQKEEKMSLLDLPIIDRYSNHERWLNAVRPFLPPPNSSETIFKVLRNEGGIEQYVVVTDTNVPAEVHTSQYERILILKGSCECKVGSNTISLGPGGFIDIPLHIVHSIQLLSPQVTAILQRIAV